MYEADSTAKMNACKIETKISNPTNATAIALEKRPKMIRKFAVENSARVPRKNTASKKWPATMFAKRRTVSVIGRKMISDTKLIKAIRGLRTIGTPGGNITFRMYPKNPCLRIPTVLYVSHEIIASTSGKAIRAFMVAFTPGRTSQMFPNRWPPTRPYEVLCRRLLERSQHPRDDFARLGGPDQGDHLWRSPSVTHHAPERPAITFISNTRRSTVAATTASANATGEKKANVFRTAMTVTMAARRTMTPPTATEARSTRENLAARASERPCAAKFRATTAAPMAADQPASHPRRAVPTTRASSAAGRKNGRAFRTISRSGSTVTISPTVLNVHEVNADDAPRYHADREEGPAGSDQEIDQVPETAADEDPREQRRDDPPSRTHAGPRVVPPWSFRHRRGSISVLDFARQRLRASFPQVGGTFHSSCEGFHEASGGVCPGTPSGPPTLHHDVGDGGEQPSPEQERAHHVHLRGEADALRAEHPQRKCRRLAGHEVRDHEVIQ